MRRAFLYLAELRAHFFAASVLPVLLGAAIAWNESCACNLNYFLLTLIGVMLLHAGANVANDYFDHRSGCDERNTEFVRPFTGGSRLIQKGLLSPKSVLIESIILYAAGSLVGFYIAFKVGYVVLILGAIGAACGFFYTAPPLKLANRGLGEFIVALNFGVLVTLGSYYVQTQTLKLSVVAVSLPLAILIGAVLFVNGFQDAAADSAAGKKTLVVRLGRKKASRLFPLIILSSYAVIVCAVVLRLMSPWALLLVPLTLPFSLKAMTVVWKCYEDSQRLARANASTVFVHLQTGLLVVAVYVLPKVL